MREGVSILGKAEDGRARKSHVCTTCRGTGRIPVPCHNCYEYKEQETIRRKTPRSGCAVCGGTGKKPSLAGKNCGGCRGRGTINGPLGRY